MLPFSQRDVEKKEKKKATKLQATTSFALKPVSSLAVFTQNESMFYTLSKKFLHSHSCDSSSVTVMGSGTQGTELLEDLQDVNVDVGCEKQALQGADVLEYQFMMLKHGKSSVITCNNKVVIWCKLLLGRTILRACTHTCIAVPWTHKYTIHNLQHAVMPYKCHALLKTEV